MYTYPKNFLSITQLIQKLKDTGMTIDSNDTAEIALTTIGYYRLKGYSFHLIDPSTKKYIEGTSLSNILRLYRFDSELSDLLFSYLSQIEVALKSQLVNAFQITHDALVLNDPSVFKDDGGERGLFLFKLRRPVFHSYIPARLLPSLSSGPSL